MRSKASVSELKSKAKEQLLGNYSIVIVSFVLNFVISYAILSLVSGAITSLAIGKTASEGSGQLNAMMSDPDASFLMSILSYIVMAVVTPILAVITTGFTYILREISYGRGTKSSDIFYAVKNHPDKVIIIALINYGVQMVLNIPMMIMNRKIMPNPSGKDFLIFMIVVVIASILNCIYLLYVSQSYLVYLDNTELSAIDCLKRSISIMKGNAWRLFYLTLTFAGYIVLVIVSLGIASLWIIPYMQMTMINFYRDLNENRTIEV